MLKKRSVLSSRRSLRFSLKRFPHFFQDFHSRRVGGYKEWYAEHASQPYDKSDHELRNLERQIEKLESSEEHDQ